VAPAAWSYYGPAVLEEINSVGGDVAEDFYHRLYEVVQRPRNAPRGMFTRNRPADYTVPFDAALLTYTLAAERAKSIYCSLPARPEGEFPTLVAPGAANVTLLHDETR
jgi:hypothetical protein